MASVSVSTNLNELAFGEVVQKPVFFIPTGGFNIAVLRETADYLVVNKPAGLLVDTVASPSTPTLKSAIAGYTMADKSTRAGIVHRLDRDTSGVMVVARTTAMHDHLKRQFQNRQVEKYYLTLVSGHPKQDRARLELPIRRSLKRPTTMTIHPAGRSAVSEYECLAQTKDYSLLRVRILTGRTHQIRVQLAYLGHPVVGDIVYGASKRPVGLHRQFLHAHKLIFSDVDGKSITTVAKLPNDLAEFWVELQ